ncbi:MAG TPA: sulfur oxidation c-type cytochrome SoxA, partial [Methylomirabilota bacterium]|nr:sulfur oxidation c-type cytochrome SoxA [Methylomirabilota bacterium]
MPRARLSCLGLALLAAACATADHATVPRWASRAIPEARGDIRVEPDGRRVAVRYRGWTTRDFGGYRTYAYDDSRPELPIQKAVMPAAVTGDPKRGRALFLNRAKGPCTGCHLVPGDDVWPAGSVGPDLSTLADRKLPDAYLYQQLWDPRVVFPKTVMPAWGAQGLFTPEELIHLVAYLQTLRGPAAPEKDPNRNPFTRAKPVGFGDNLDPTNNPAVLRAESAEALWTAKGPSGKACADCHAGGVDKSMRGVATRYPRYVATYRRTMAIEEFLGAHGPETTGRPLAVESAQNIDLAMRIKMASNGLPVAVDTTSPAARAALVRGEASFHKRVGERNHACADCHTPDRGANKFLGGRFLGDVTAGLTRHFPTWRTSQNDAWDMRRRFQWCMTPLGTNMLAADAVEYAELELYLTQFDNGKPMSVPGI